MLYLFIDRYLSIILYLYSKFCLLFHNDQYVSYYNMRDIVRCSNNNKCGTGCVYSFLAIYFFIVIILLFITIECINYFLNKQSLDLSLLPNTDGRIE